MGTSCIMTLPGRLAPVMRWPSLAGQTQHGGNILPLIPVQSGCREVCLLWKERAMALTLLIPKCIHEALALLLDALLQAPLPQAEVSEGGQGEPPLLLPHVPVGGDQSWQKHATMSQGRSVH